MAEGQAGQVEPVRRQSAANGAAEGLSDYSVFLSAGR